MGTLLPNQVNEPYCAQLTNLVRKWVCIGYKNALHVRRGYMPLEGIASNSEKIS